jgi:8-oxo-dGTP pyrophosphatase MutT (NUDIX family)
LSDDDFRIPRENLPPGFVESIQRPPHQVVEPKPAATIVLLREGGARSGSRDTVAREHDEPGGGLEVLLLQRVRSSGFVPGAWVFPGGRVDSDDAGPSLVARLDGLAAEVAARRLGLAPDADPPALAYYVAALREAFEETGILVGRDAAGEPPPSAAEDVRVRRLRERLLEDEDSFPLLLDQMGCRMDASAVEYIAHWITPEAEPRRFDTRFFAAVVPAGVESLHHTRELSASVWLTPTEALGRNREGRFPMVFPTIRTLQALAAHPTPAAALESFRGREITAILPRLVSTPTGVGIRVDPHQAG